jgi:F-box-like
MANNLPNELIREILLPVLDVPNDMLRDLSDTSPFWRPSHISTSSLVAVCKTWMDIATPLLYHVVILRSKAQAYALARTLRKHKELGAHIKKFRVEGAYGASMRTIITEAPNITDLCISFDIRSSDSVKGLCSSLSLINPRCLVVLDALEERTNTSCKDLAAKITSCLKTWTNMVSELFVHSSSATEVQYRLRLRSTSGYPPIICSQLSMIK